MWVPVSHSSDHCALRVQLESQTDIRLLRVLNAVPNIWALIYEREQPSQVYILERQYLPYGGSIEREQIRCSEVVIEAGDDKYLPIRHHLVIGINFAEINYMLLFSLFLIIFLNDRLRNPIGIAGKILRLDSRLCSIHLLCNLGLHHQVLFL